LLDTGDPRKKNDKVMANFHKAYSFIRYENFAKYGEAEKLLREALALEERAAYLYVTMSYLMEYQNKYDSAIYFAKRAESIIPTWSVPKNILGNLYSDLYQWEKAISYHKEVLKLDSNHVWSYNNIGIAMLEMDRIKEAEQYFLRSLEMKKGSGKERLNRDWAITYSNLAAIYLERGLMAKAEDYYEIADSIDNSFTLPKRKISELYSFIDGEKSALLLKKSISISPYDAENYYQLAELYRKYPLNKQSVVSADSLYRKAISLNPYYEWYYAGLGYLHNDLKQKDTALYYLRKGADVSRNSADALYNLGFFHQSSSQWDSAAIYYQKSLAKNPYDIAISSEYTDLLLLKADTVAAEKQLLQLTKLQYNSPKAFFVLGNFYFKTGSFRNAIQAYKKSIAIDSSYSNAVKAIAYTELYTGNAINSRNYIKLLLSLIKEDGIVIDYLNAVAETSVKIPLKKRAGWLSGFVSLDVNNELINELIAEASYISNADLNKTYLQIKKAESGLSYSSSAIIKWLFLYSIEVNDKKLMVNFAQRYIDELLNTEPAIYAVALKLTGNNVLAKKTKATIKQTHLSYFRMNFKKLYAVI
ncbi:MAG: tetratricopeptide repeat protein, partial [Sphingobacteriales bacterium]